MIKDSAIVLWEWTDVVEARSRTEMSNIERSLSTTEVWYINAGLAWLTVISRSHVHLYNYNLISSEATSQHELHYVSFS